MDSASATPQAPSSSRVEQLASGVTREWLCERQIVVYTLKDVRRESIDVWAEAFKSDINDWPADRPFRVIHDFSSSGVISTPYGRARAQELVNTCPQIRVRAAFVLSTSVLSQLIIIFLGRQNQRPNRVRRTFTTREQAIAWLLSFSS